MLRDYQPADFDEVLEINQSNVPEVGPLDEEKLALFVRISPCLKVIEIDGDVVGMLIGLTESDTDYRSLNFGWFRERLDRFAYIDRIALAVAARGQGWGPALYEDLESWARSIDRPAMCAEVNTLPPNPRSMRFHLLNGFEEIGRFQPYGPEAEVAMLRKPLHPTP
ncbi:MAG: GNAT family N-acetyltransferase [Actinomycetota bacterium]|nr:GNAT family N-acetyltransferase [Actinomycetota bacterium]